MLTCFPTYFSQKAIKLFFVVLAVVSFLFIKRILPFVWIVWGIAEVLLFFYYAPQITKKWQQYSEKKFVANLFKVALLARVAYVIFSYFFYIEMTGKPFEFGAADAMFYDNCGHYGAELLRNGNFHLYTDLKLYSGASFSDLGYPILLSVEYYLTGDSVLLTRIIKALLSAYMCVLIYRLASRNFGESTGRMAGVFAMLMPHFWYYCGLQIKETEMVFIVVAYLERADYVLRERVLNVKNVLLPILCAATIFFFRTVLGITALMAFMTAILITSSKIVKIWKKIVLGLWVMLCAAYFVGGTLLAELEETWNRRSTDQQKSIELRVKRGNEFAKYAGAAVFAPLMFTIPFPTVVNVPNQELQMQVCGNNYIKNIMSFFTILAVFLLLYRGYWRNHILLLAFILGYLGILAMSAFAQSERFHLPILPVATILSAYGVSQMNNKYKRYFNIWIVFMFLAVIGWSWFKLKGRGMI